MIDELPDDRLDEAAALLSTLGDEPAAPADFPGDAAPADEAELAERAGGTPALPADGASALPADDTLALPADGGRGAG